MTKRFKAAVIGGSGYGGGELIRRLLLHPHVELVRVASVDFVGEPLSAAHPHLEDQTERALVARRAYQRRVVFGEPHLRGLVFIGSTTVGVPAYFPADMADKLPAAMEAFRTSSQVPSTSTLSR